MVVGYVGEAFDGCVVDVECLFCVAVDFEVVGYDQLSCLVKNPSVCVYVSWDVCIW